MSNGAHLPDLQRGQGWRRRIAIAEEGFSVVVLLLMMGLPLLEAVFRSLFENSIPGSVLLVRHGTLWIAFSGAALASREDRHLGFGAGFSNAPESTWNSLRKVLAYGTAAGVAFVLAYAAFRLVSIERDNPASIGNYLPLWLAEAVMPLGLALAAWRFVTRASSRWSWRLAAFIVLLAILLFSQLPAELRPDLFWPGMVLLVSMVLLGAPIFILMGGAAALSFYCIGEADLEITSLVAIPTAAYEIVTDPFLPAIPLFTAAGTVMALGNTSRRLTDLFRAAFGWLPGGVAVATMLVFAFFTTFSGASGVTILALGGLLMPLLLNEKYPERFSLGLVTSAGSLGMLLPPCLPVILLAVTARTPIDKMYIAGFLPALLLIALLGAYGVWTARRSGARNTAFSKDVFFKEIRRAKWEILLPVMVLGGIFGGLTTLVEAAALTLLYTIVTVCFIHRDYSWKDGLWNALVQSAILTGGILIIIGMAKGFTDYLIEAEVVASAVEWVTETIQSKIVFLLVLNLLLLIVGCLMDIVSAIIVVVPMILPMAQAYGIPPTHIGIIFLVNLEIGFLTPPVGMNLFMSAYTFGKPLTQVYRAALPFILLWAIAVLLVSYVPWFTQVFL